MDDDLEPLEASMTATEFFLSLEDCDSKKVEDFKTELNNSVLYLFNVKGQK